MSIRVVFGLFILLCWNLNGSSQSIRFGFKSNTPQPAKTQALYEIEKAYHFLEKEFSLHADLFLKQDSLPPTVFGLPYRGDFVLSGFASSLAQWYAHPLYKSPVPEKHLQLLKKLILTECPKAETFSQYNILKTLDAFGLPLEENALWKTFSANEQSQIRAAADVRRMYDPTKKTVRNGRPANYLGLAAKIVSMAYHMKLEQDSTLVHELIQQNLELLKQNEGWLNDGKPGEFRFDRYHFEYLRFLYEAAETMNRIDVLHDLKPFLQQSDRLWSILAHPISGSRFAYGRSLQNTWEDVWEYEPFLLKRQISDQNKGDKTEIFYRFFQAWDFYRSYEYDSLRHHSRMLDPGRGCYSYVSESRIWGYSIHALGKMMHGLREIHPYANGVVWTKASDETKMEPKFFPLKQGYGLWLHTFQATRVVIPVVTGIGKPTHSDYMPIPFAEGISMPPVALASSHLTPTIRHDGKLYQPLWQLGISNPSLATNFSLEAEVWISAKDTLPASYAPKITMRCKPRKNGLRLHYAASLSQSIPKNDSLIFSIFYPDFVRNPYAKSGDFKWKFSGGNWLSETRNLNPTESTAKGAFTRLEKQEIFTHPLSKDLSWKADLIFK